MAKKKKVKAHAVKVDAGAPSAVPVVTPPVAEYRATLPAALPRPDLSLWMLAGVIGLMLATLLRELVHFLAVRAAGVTSARLLPNAVRFDNQQQFWVSIEARDFAGAAQFAPPLAMGWAELAVPVMTVALAWAAAWGVRREDLRPWLAGLGLAAPLRLFTPAVYVVMVVWRWLRGASPHRAPELAEYGVELLWGLPAAFLLLVEVVLCVPAVAQIVSVCELGAERVRAIALAAGLCFGVALLAAIAT